MNHTIEFFDFQAPIYDLYQESCIPKYREALETSVGFLASVQSPNRVIRLLDLGCGTGNTALVLADTFPNAEIHCIDASTKMLESARTKTAGSATQRFHFSQADFGSTDWADSLQQSAFDAVVSVFVLEHVSFSNYKQILDSVFSLITPGGWLVTVEAYAGQLLHQIFGNEMATLKKEAGEKGTIDSEFMDRMDALSREKETHYFAEMMDKKRWWIEAGFQDVQFIWQYYCTAILVGRVPL